MIKSIQIHETGGPDVMKLEAVELPSPGPDEVQIKHTAIGVNFLDLVTRQGFFPTPLPCGLGREAVGIIQAIGSQVKGFSEGDSVSYFTPETGAYAEARNVSESMVVKIPEALDEQIVAASFSKGLTAHHLVRETFKVEAGQWIVVQAAAGGVGSIIAQWATALSAHVIGLVGSEAKVEQAKKNGCSHVLLSGDNDWADKVKSLSGGGAHVVYDSIGKDTFEKSMKALRPRGMLVAFGNASGPPPTISPMDLMMQGSIYLTRTSGKDYYGTPEGMKAGAEAFFKMLSSKKINIHVGQRFPLEEAANAHAAIEARETIGCTLLLP